MDHSIAAALNEIGHPSRSSCAQAKAELVNSSQFDSRSRKAAETWNQAEKQRAGKRWLCAAGSSLPSPVERAHVRVAVVVHGRVHAVWAVHAREHRRHIALGPLLCRRHRPAELRQQAQRDARRELPAPLGPLEEHEAPEARAVEPACAEQEVRFTQHHLQETAGAAEVDKA